MHHHAIVWIDHRKAQVIGFGVRGIKGELLRSRAKVKHLHHKANSIGDGRIPIDNEFFGRIVRELNGARSFVIAGPSSAKKELAAYIHTNDRELAKSIRGVVPLAQVGEGELLNFARCYLKAADRVSSE
jgi:stalled ribosome rescue protein Dom34